jgi:hypothetical protein
MMVMLDATGSVTSLTVGIVNDVDDSFVDHSS